jgi:hypothetical protein
MATQAQRLSSSAQEDRGRSPTVRLRRRWVSTPILANIQHMRTVVQFSAVRSLDTPPPPDTAWWGVRGSPENLPGPHFPFQASESICCDSVAIARFQAIND